MSLECAQLGELAEGKAAATSPSLGRNPGTPGTGPSRKGLPQSSLKRLRPVSLTGFFVLEKHQMLLIYLFIYIFRL